MPWADIIRPFGAERAKYIGGILCWKSPYVKGGHKMNQEELIQDWLDSSDQNYLSMQNMFNNDEYVWSLFVGHLCIEKLLKACYVKSVGNIAPRIHDLYKLAVKCDLEMTEEKMDSLQYITLFNIEARYEDYKREFYHKCTRDFAEKNILVIKGIRAWLLEKIKG
jgi:HEPN domain-containing protein